MHSYFLWHQQANLSIIRDWVNHFNFYKLKQILSHYFLHIRIKYPLLLYYWLVIFIYNLIDAVSQAYPLMVIYM